MVDAKNVAGATALQPFEVVFFPGKIVGLPAQVGFGSFIAHQLIKEVSAPVKRKELMFPFAPGWIKRAWIQIQSAPAKGKSPNRGFEHK